MRTPMQEWKPHNRKAIDRVSRTHLRRSSTSPAVVRQSIPLQEGTRVESRWNDADYWFKGVVSGRREEGEQTLFTITYDDGDVERDVPADRIRVLSKEDEAKGHTRADSSDDQEFCVVCLRASNPATMLMCDGCDYGCHHMECLDPPLDTLPEGDWFCPQCVGDNADVVVNKKSNDSDKSTVIIGSTQA